VTEANGQDHGDLSMLDLFRSDVEIHTETITDRPLGASGQSGRLRQDRGHDTGRTFHKGGRADR